MGQKRGKSAALSALLKSYWRVLEGGQSAADGARPTRARPTVSRSFAEPAGERHSLRDDHEKTPSV